MPETYLVPIYTAAQQAIDQEICSLETHPPIPLPNYKFLRPLQTLLLKSPMGRIKQYKAAIRTLKIRRNSHSPVCRLPDELLSGVMINTKAEYPYRTGNLLVLTGVCHHWRHVALNTPILWAHISLLEKVRLTAMLMQRSMPAPIHLNLDLLSVPYVSMKELCKSAVIASNRIQGLEICFGQHHAEELGSFLSFSSTFPPLDIRSIHLEQRSESHEPTDPPRGIMWDCMTSLRVLKLVGLYMPRTFPHLSALRHLEVRMGGNSAPDLTMIKFIELLQKLSNAESITFDSLSFGASHPQVSTRFSASLPHLQSLTLSFRDIGDAKLFTRLDFPHSCRIHFLFCAGTNLDGLNGIFSLLEARSQLPVQRGQFMFYVETGCKLELFLKGESRSIIELTLPPIPAIHLDRLLSCSVFQRVTQLELSFIACPQWLRDYLKSLSSEAMVTCLDIESMNFSGDTYAGQLNQEALWLFVKEHSENNNPVRNLRDHGCKMNRLFADELGLYTQLECGSLYL